MPSRPRDVVLSKEKIGQRVRTFREQRGLSQGKLAKLLGTHPQSISQIERGSEASLFSKSSNSRGPSRSPAMNS